MTLRLLVIGLAFFIPSVAGADNSVSLPPADAGIEVVTASGITRIQPWLAGTIRIESAPGTTLPPKKSLAVIATPDASGWSSTEDASSLKLKGPRLTAVLNKQSGLISVFAADGTVLLQQTAQAFQPAQNPARDGLEITTTFQRFPNEHFYGGGVIGGGKIKGDDSLRDPTAHLHLQERNAQISIPVLYSSRGYGLFWDNPSEGNLNLTPTSVTWNSTAGDLADFYVMAGPTADQAVGEYRQLTGAAPLFPEWAYGFWFSKNKFVSQNEILAAAAHFRAGQFPLDLLVQDYFYWVPGAGQPNPALPQNTNWGSHQFAPERYPNPRGMIDQLHDQDHLHFMAVVWGKFDPPTDHYKELAAAHTLFPPAGDHFGNSLQYYDPFDPQAREIYGRQVMDSLLPLGVDAFWVDGAEPAMLDMKKFASFDSLAGPVSRVMNAFPMVHVSSLYQAQRAATDQKRVVLLPRSAWAGTQRYAAANWTGDISSDWRTLAWQIEGLQNYSIAGLPYLECSLIFDWASAIGIISPLSNKNAVILEPVEGSAPG